MADIIVDGTGAGYAVGVDSDNKLRARATMLSEIQEAVVEGRAFNINTGWINSISADSALLYVYNGDEEDLVVDAIAVGLKESSATEVQGVYIVSGPTGGTLVSAATNCDMIANRRVGDSKSFSSSSFLYKATASGQTLTGGSDSALFAQTDGGRLYAVVDYVVPKGKAIGIRLEVLGSFSDAAYAALICHKRKQL